MPRATVEFLPEAVAEAREAQQWYRERNEAAADAFLAKLDRLAELVARAPDVWLKYCTRHSISSSADFPICWFSEGGKTSSK